MEIIKETKNNCLTVNLKGRLDSNTKDIFEKDVIPVFDNPPAKIVINFSELDYISSAGLRVLLISAKKAKAVKTDLVLCGMKEFIREIFDMAGFSNIFTIVPSLEDAVKS
ncbi:MAG: STAS domain-containing protein [Candidatus Cloacimonetes bacterium]|nr:STAS domain-containing protein [Candidatus Cloacimonadota bacterium]